MSDTEFPVVVCGTTVNAEPFGTGKWVVRLSDAADYFCVDGLDDAEDAEMVARNAAALLRRTVERATAGLQSRLDAAMAFADPTARKALLAALSPETIETYLLAHGWVSHRMLATVQEWLRAGCFVSAPLRADFRDYGQRALDSLVDIGRAENRPAVAVYLDMVAK